jgi:flagellar secretion chaperone FliS
MSSNPADNYLRVKVMTATPEQLQMMLYDGAIRFCERARAALEKKNFEQSYTLISKVQKILTEMSCTLKHDVAPDLCGQLSALYTYVYRKLIEANVHQDLVALDEAAKVLKYQRETWGLLLEQLGKTKAAAVAKRLDLPAPSERMEASICVQG